MEENGAYILGTVNAFSDLESLERLSYATLWAPLMIEVVVEN